MPKFTPRLFAAAIALCASLTGALSVLPATASASTTQLALIQDGRLLTDPVGTLARFRELGATAVRVFMPWATITRSPLSRRVPAHFNAADPNAYAASSWAAYDAIVRDAKADGITVDFTVAGGAPVWAEGSGIPASGARNLYFAWKPSAAAYGQFVHAVGQRYSGSFKPRGASTPLPAVHFWAIWNEANFGEDLGPQAINGSRVSVGPMMYRGLANAGYSALRSTGHAQDTILIGEFAARGMEGGPSRRYPQGFPGQYGQTKPLEFIRTLYCVDRAYRQLRGAAALSVGCPTSAAGSRRFRAQNPALFSVTGVGDHPYPINTSPLSDGRSDPNFAAFPDLGRLGRVLDSVQRAYGSHNRFSIYNDEYGYITNPPRRYVSNSSHCGAPCQYVSQTTAAFYINWAEYLSWRNPRIKSYMQYLLFDPPVGSGIYGGFASGLLSNAGKPKPTYDAYRLPLYLPHTATGSGRSLEVWGDARPAPFAKQDTGQAQSVQIQFQSGSRGAFTTIATVPVTSAQGYFDTQVKFPGSGAVRLAWTYPKTDNFLALNLLGRTEYSRNEQVTVR